MGHFKDLELEETEAELKRVLENGKECFTCGESFIEEEEISDGENCGYCAEKRKKLIAE